MDNNQNPLKKFKSLNIQSIRESLLSLPRWFLILWILMNLLIPAYGLLLYYWQYAYYHPIFWIFIPDSSTFSILFGFFLIITFGFKKNVQVLNIVTFIGLVRVFFGYLVVFAVQPPFFDIISLTAHTVELLEGIIVLLFINVDQRSFQVGGSITIIDWFFDLFNPFGLPTLFLYPLDEINQNNTAPYIEIFAIVFTAIILILMTYLRWKHWAGDEIRHNWVDSINEFDP
ncbi:MAG: DUF1405 domain-containing protein [Candidatus Hodarchaeales archaeon]